MKVLLLNLMLLGLSSLWMGCECDQAGGKAQGKQCKSDGGSELATVTGIGNNGEPSSIHISQMDGQTVRLPMELSWDAVDGASYYMIRLHQPGGDCTADSSDLYQLRVEAPATSAMIDPEPMVPDGDYLLCVVAYDGSDNVLQPIQSANITIDNTGPLGMTAAWFFPDAIGSVDLEFTLPANVDDYARVAVVRSDVLGPMPSCSDQALDDDFTSFTAGAKLTLTDSVGAEQAGYALNYKVCAYDALGNVSELEMANVRTTLTIHTLFITENPHNGNFAQLVAPDGDGLEGADEFCRSEASDGPNWKAVLSDNSTGVANHISMRGPVTNSNGTIARSASQLLGALSSQVAYEKDGDAASGNIWTGANPDGSKSSGRNCLNWIHGTSARSGAYGNLASGNFIGSGDPSDESCDLPKKLACISPFDVKRVDNVVNNNFLGLDINFSFDSPAEATVEIRRSSSAKPVSGSCVDPSDTIVQGMSDSVPAAGRYSYRICVFDKYGGTAVSSKALGSKPADLTTFNEVFITANTVQGDMGGSTPDAICADAATVAGLGSGWKALISTFNQDASSILAGDNDPLLDLSSNLITSDSANVWSQDLISTVASDEYVNTIPSSADVWTGSFANGAKDTGKFCSSNPIIKSWDQNTNGFIGSYGAASSKSGWFKAAFLDHKVCSEAKSLYCVRN